MTGDYNTYFIADSSTTTTVLSPNHWYIVQPKQLYYYPTNNKKMTKLNDMQKALLDKDTKTLIEAGILDSELELTCKGQNKLNALLFADKKTELLKVAEEIIEKRKEKK